MEKSCARPVSRRRAAGVTPVRWAWVGLAALFLVTWVGSAGAEPIYARELVYRPFLLEDQAKVLVVTLELYAVIPEELERDLAGQRELREVLSRVFDRAYPSFYRAGWLPRRPRTEARQELLHERVRVEVDRRHKGDVITYYNNVCDPDDLFNKKKYREGNESFTEYWDGLAAEVERCLKDRFGLR